MYSIEEINLFDQDKFVRTFGNVVEHYPRCALYLYGKRPFPDLETLMNEVDIFLAEISSSVDHEKILNLHPDLAGKLAAQNLLTAESRTEQASAELDKLSPDDVKELNNLNELYKQIFQFPFVICARENKFEAIINGLRNRMKNSKIEEISIAIDEVKKISKYRILNIIKE